jgi:hypothetical protein
MNPVPGRAQINYPTPVVTDRLIIEYVSLEVGTAENIPYGTLWDDQTQSHTSFSQSYPEFQLVYKAPALNDNNWWERRVWVNPRINQGSYNYSLVYAEGDNAFPTVTRVTVVKRSEYTPETILTPDALYPQAKLIDQKLVNETNPQEANSLYVTVVKQYMTIPGPIVTTQDFDTDINMLVYTNRQVVLATDTFNNAAAPLTLEMRESPQTKYSKLRITSYLLTLPATYVNYETGRYDWPNLFPAASITVDLLQLTTDPERSEARVKMDGKRDAPNVPALMKVTTSFATTSPAVATLYVIPTKTLYYNGVSFQISYQNALNNEITVGATFVDDAKYGDLIESHTFAATTPTASTYASSIIGTYQITGYQDTRWRGQIRVIQQTETLMV